MPQRWFLLMKQTWFRPLAAAAYGLVSAVLSAAPDFAAEAQEIEEVFYNSSPIRLSLTLPGSDGSRRDLCLDIDTATVEARNLKVELVDETVFAAAVGSAGGASAPARQTAAVMMKTRTMAATGSGPSSSDPTILSATARPISMSASLSSMTTARRRTDTRSP